MYKLNISSYIKQSHKEYILDSQIEENMKLFSSNSIYIDKYGKEHTGFCNLIIREIDNLKNDTTNIFLGEPKILNNYIKQIEKEYKRIVDAINDESTGYGKEILNIFGYKKFSSEGMELYYQIEKEFLKSLNSTSVRKKLKDIKGDNSRYNSDIFVEYLDYIYKKVNDIISINGNDKEIKIVFSKFKEDINTLKGKLIISIIWTSILRS